MFLAGKVRAPSNKRKQTDDNGTMQLRGFAFGEHGTTLGRQKMAVAEVLFL